MIEAGAVDGRRKLVIVRRDNVEHLIMIGGPTDILIEANIVRGQAASREVARAATATERPAPAAEPATSWPLAPEPGAPRPRPAAAEETLQWHPVEPVVPMPPAPPPRRPARVDTLAGLANELSRPNGHSDVTVAPHRPAPSLDIDPAAADGRHSRRQADGAGAGEARRRANPPAATLISPTWRNALKRRSAAPANRPQPRPPRPLPLQPLLPILLLPIRLRPILLLPAHRESIL